MSTQSFIPSFEMGIVRCGTARQRSHYCVAGDKQQFVYGSRNRWLLLFLLCAIASMGLTASAKAETFQTTKPLAFTKVYEGANPLPQVFTVATSDSNFHFYASVVDGTGGDWLTITNENDAYTPQAVTVSANPDVTLAAGTYTAQIALRSADGAVTQTIPVSLIIRPTSAAFFDVLPGALTFSMVTKDTIIPAQTIPIRNATRGTISFNASASTYNTGGWITLSATSGTAPYLLSAGINVSKLPGQGLTAGTFTGQVVLQTSGDTVTIPVTVTVGDSVFRQANPLSFNKIYEGGDPLPQVFTIASTGSGFHFYASAVNGTGGSWLRITSENDAYTPQAVTVAANPDVTLTAGTYTAEILGISADGSQPLVIPVTLTVQSVPAPSFDELPGQLAFSMVTKGIAPPPQAVPIRNAGSGTLPFTVSSSTADGSGWITLSALSGTAPSSLKVGIDSSKLPGQGLSAGTFTGQVILQTGGNTVTIPVTVTVGDSVFEQVNPLSFSKTYKGADPLPQVFTIASTGSGFHFSASAVSGTGGSWLSITSENDAYTPQVVTVAANPDVTLAAGTYTAEILGASADGSQPLVIPVTLTINPATTSSFDELPGQLAFSMVTKGNAPPPQVVPIRNAGSGALPFTASSSTADGSGWITLSAASGTAPYFLNVGVNSSKLPGQGLTAGTFTGQVVLQAGGETVTIPVTVTVGDSVFEQINPLSFNKIYEGSDPLPQVFTIASTGAGFHFYASAVNGTGGSWLSITSENDAYTSQAVTVAVNPDLTLAAGTYTAEILGVSADGSQPLVIPVTLTINPTTTASFDAIPGGLTFSGQTNAKALNPQSISIRNAGSGTLNWVATAHTADSGGWITLSAASGVAPSTLTVSVNVSKLPGQGLSAGSFTGQVMLQSASGTVTIPVTVTLGDSVFVPVAAVSFSKPYQGLNPSAQTVTISSTDSGFHFYASAINGTGGSWLNITSENDAYTPQTVTLTVNPNVNLAAGIYTAEIYAISAGGDEPMVIPVSLTITGSTATATPRYNPAGGSYSTAQNVTITSPTTDAAIYYTLDGSTPTTTSLRYTSPIQVTATETIKAIAIAPGFPQSAVATAAYTITATVAATPVATSTITISEATSSVTVYYTTNGTTPTSSSAKYTAPITLTSGAILKFIAIGPNYSSSPVRTVTTTIQ